MWTAAERRRIQIDPKIVPGGSLHSHSRALARALMPLTPRADEAAEFHRELELYSRSDPELRALMADQWKALFDKIAHALESESGDRLTIPRC